MSQDLGLFLINNCFDIVIENGDLKADGGLETAVAISLFSDRRVTEDELPRFQESKRGWWGDAISEIDKDKIGSKMWLLDRGKRTQTDLNKLEDYARDSLRWLIEDGVAISVEVAGEFTSDGQTIINVLITRPNNKETRYSVLWNAQELRRA